jgi:hypothetical protein
MEPKRFGAADGEIMRKTIVAALAFGAVTLGSGAALAYDPGLPWCIVYTNDYVRVCDYPNFASCAATASGNVGYCTPNPAFFSSNEEAWSQAYGNPYGLPPPPPPRRRR